MTPALVAALVLAAAILTLGGAPEGRLADRTPAGRVGGTAATGPGRRRHARGRRHVARHPPMDLLLDLVAAAMRAGAPPDRALAVVAEAAGGPEADELSVVAARQALGASAEASWSGVPERLAPLRDALVLCVAAGVPGADLLAAAAEDERRARHRQAQVAAQRLGVRLVLPLGLCALPAFVAWGVVPVVLSLAGSAVVP